MSPYPLITRWLIKGILQQRPDSVRVLFWADVLPIAIPALQFVAKEYLLRRDEAERGVVNLQIAYEWRQAHLGGSHRRRIVGLVIYDDLLDVQRAAEVC